MKQYTFLLEYGSYEEMVRSIFNKTGGDIEKTKAILQQINETDPNAFKAIENTGKKSTARSIVRGVAAKSGTDANLKMAGDLERGTGRIVSDAEKAIEKNGRTLRAAADDARYAASRAPVQNLKTATSSGIQKDIDSAKKEIASKVKQTSSARRKLIDAAKESRRAASVLDVPAQSALDAVEGKGISRAFNRAKIEDVIGKKMARLQRTTNPAEAESLGRQIERLGSKLGLSDKLNELRRQVRNITGKFAGATTANNELLSAARKEISGNLGHAGFLRDSAKAVETLAGTPAAKKSKGVMSTIGGWLRRVGGKVLPKIAHK